MTARIALRRLRSADLRGFQAYRHDEQVARFQGWQPEPDETVAAFIEAMAAVELFPLGQWVQLGIADIDDDALIGDVGICVGADGRAAELGFTLSRGSQGMGLAREAVDAAITLIFGLTAVSRIVSITDSRNVASIRLLQRVGMRQVETLQSVFRGEACTELVFNLPRPS